MKTVIVQFHFTFPLQKRKMMRTEEQKRKQRRPTILTTRTTMCRQRLRETSVGRNLHKTQSQGGAAFLQNEGEQKIKIKNAKKRSF